jgi:hypothetical protein
MQNMNIKGEWIWRFIITAVGVIFTALAGYILWTVQNAYAEQKAFNAELHRRVSLLEFESAGNAINHVTLKEFTGLDKRVTRTEDAVVTLREYLPRIEKKLDELTRRP